MVETQAEAPIGRVFDGKSCSLVQVDNDRGAGGLVDEIDTANTDGDTQSDGARTRDRFVGIGRRSHTHRGRFHLLLAAAFFRPPRGHRQGELVA